MEVGVGSHVSAAGSYRPPVFVTSKEFPPHTIISLPVQMALWRRRADGASALEVLVQLSEAGSYRPPVSRVNEEPSLPPQMTIRLPVHTAVWLERGEGLFVVEVGTQVSVTGSYRPPELR